MFLFMGNLFYKINISIIFKFTFIVSMMETMINIKIYNDFYAVCPTTRASIFSLLTYKSDINTSTATVSDILKQKTPSTVIDTFRENGYQIKYHFPNEYLVHTQKHLFTNFRALKEHCI